MVDVLLHILGALGMQAAGAVLLGLLGYGIGTEVNDVVLCGTIGTMLGSIAAGVGSTWYWRRREINQARDRQINDGYPTDDVSVWGRTKHIEWRTAAIANVAGVPVFSLVALFILRATV